MREPRPALPGSLASDGTIRAARRGRGVALGLDIYHILRTSRWPTLLAFFACGYALANLVFACAYLAGGDCVKEARPGSFADAFFFSVQTMATIGYGEMRPGTTYAHVVVTIESFVGLLMTATLTGVVFGKFATPRPRVLFSNNLLVTEHDGHPTLTFRVANERQSHMLVEAQIRVTAILDTKTSEGRALRRLVDLNLVRSSTPLFALSWQVFHPIDAASPLRGLERDELEELVGVLVTMTGIDDSLAQTVHARHAYTPKDIVRRAHFVDVITAPAGGSLRIDYERLHDFDRD